MSKLDLHNNSLIGKEWIWVLFSELDISERELPPVLNEPVSVENFNGPPNIDSLLGSGEGSISLTSEHEIKDNVIIIKTNRLIKKPTSTNYSG